MIWREIFYQHHMNKVSPRAQTPFGHALVRATPLPLLAWRRTGRQGTCLRKCVPKWSLGTREKPCRLLVSRMKKVGGSVGDPGGIVPIQPVVEPAAGDTTGLYRKIFYPGRGYTKGCYPCRDKGFFLIFPVVSSRQAGTQPPAIKVASLRLAGEESMRPVLLMNQVNPHSKSTCASMSQGDESL